MHNYAIAEVSGHQYRIEEGTQVIVPRLEAEVGSTVTLDKLLLINSEGSVTVGAPYIEGAQAEAKVIEHNRSRKVLVFKKKRRKGFRRTRSARQHLTTLEIASVKS